MQSYQEVTKEIIKEISFFKELKNVDIHKYFFDLKKKEPNRFERLLYDTNGHIPISNTLDDILQDLMLCGDFYPIELK